LRVGEAVPDNLQALVVVSNRVQTSPIHIVPKNIVLGIGCRRGTSLAALEKVLVQALQNIDQRAIAVIGSVDIKQDEVGLITLSEKLGVPFQVFSVAELQAQAYRFPHSEFVEKTLGVGSVSQPVAWLLSEGNVLGETLKQDGITMTLGVRKCCI
jgi:cobalt-precorrin 5A hydrolase